MALKKCTECGNEVSSKAGVCPNCGAPVKKPQKMGCLSSIIIIIVALFLVGKVSSCFEERTINKERIAAAGIAVQIEKERVEKEEIEKQKHAQKKAEFETSIEDHYSNLTSALNANDDDGVSSCLKPFIVFNRMDYKNVVEIKRDAEIKNLMETVKDLPSSKIIENLEVYKKLIKLDPSNDLYKRKVTHYSSKYQKLKLREAREKQKANSDLELLSWHWSSGHGYVTAEGQVKNISRKKLERVQAMVTWSDGHGNMITSDDSLIEYDPIMPGQVSPFKVMERYNPQMKSANLEFKFMRGNRIPTYHEKK